MIGDRRVRGVCAALTIERQQRLRDPRLDFGFMVEAADDAFDNAAKVDAHIGLHRDIDVGAIMAGQPRQAIERLADRVQPGERDLERTLLLGLARDLINPVAQLEIGAAERLLRWAIAPAPRCRAPPPWRWRSTRRA